MKHLLIITGLWLTFTGQTLLGQTFDWAGQLGGPNSETSNATTLDNAGNVYTTGDFSGTVDFDPGDGTYDLTSFGNDLFISKLDASGSFVWAKQMGGAGASCIGYSIFVDDDGNIYTTGEFVGTVDFDPGTGTYNLTSQTSGYYDIFISKLDASGNFVWAKQMGGPYSDKGSSITADLAGNVFTTGFFYGTADFDPGEGTYILNSNGSEDTFVSKLDASGNFVWARHMGGTSQDKAYSISIDNDGNIYTAGDFYGNADFDPGTGAYQLFSFGGQDVFISKLDASGNFVWAGQLGGTDDDYCRSMIIDSAANIYTTGFFWGTSDFDPGTGTFELTSEGASDIFISKLDASGSFIWAKRLGGTGNNQSHSICVDTAHNVYTTGRFNGTADFDPGAGTYSMTTDGAYDIYINKLDASGNFVWAVQMGDSLTYSYVETGKSIVVDEAQSVYTTGIFWGTADFDPGPGTYELSSFGNRDVFIQKMFECTTTESETDVTACDSYTVPSGDETYTESGTYYDTIPNAAGCDSLLTINLIINLSTESEIDVDVCDSYTVPSGDETYTESGIYYDTIPNAVGCDSLITINLSVNNSYSEINVTACDSYTVPSGDETYTESGTYYDTIPNTAGCDSLMTINLTVNYTTESEIDVTACDSYTVPSGDETYTESGTYYDTIPNTTGCDSLMTIYLVINYSTESEIDVTECFSYTVPSGDETYTESGTYYDTIPNAAGCDSLMTINLTIDTVDVSVTVMGDILFANATNAIFQWLDCENDFAVIPGETEATFAPGEDGTYAVEVTQNSCTDTSACIAMINVGIYNNNSLSHVYIYPNPNDGKVSIYLGSLEDVTINIYDMTGRLIYSKDDIKTKVFRYILHEAPGIYIIEVNVQDVKQRYKLVKR